MKPNQERDAYGGDRGGDALARQNLEARDRWYCCGEMKATGHHPKCRRYEPPDPPPQPTLW